MGKWWFIDMQTLGLSSNAKVLSLGILCLDEDLNDFSEDVLYTKGLNIFLDLKDQANRTFDKQTLQYWKEVFEIKKDIFKGRKYTIKEAYELITKYININEINIKEDIVWSRGLFDKFLWQSLYPKDTYFPSYLWRDSSTALYVLTGNIFGNISSKYLNIKYDSLYNCVFEYIRLKKAQQLYDN